MIGIVRNRAKLPFPADFDGLQALEADVNDAERMQSILQQIPVPDVIINNAGYGLYGPFEELGEEQLRAQFETNFFSPLRIIRHCLPAMRERGSGRIINISSILGQLVIPTGSAYCSSKWALEAASEAMRYELAPLGIEVCLVEPGLIRTNFKANMQLTPALEAEDSPYRFLNRLIQKEITRYGRLATPPERAARSIARLLRKRRLPARFRVGLDASFYGAVKRLLPASVLDAIQRSYTENLHRKD